MHRSGKFKCFGQYNAEGFEDRVAWFGTVALAVFFLIKMFIGPAYFLVVFNNEEVTTTFTGDQKSHAVCALVTVLLRIIYSLSLGSLWCKDGHYKDTVPFKEIFNEKEECDKYMTEEKDTGITVFFAKRYYWPLFSPGFFGFLPFCKKYLNKTYETIDPMN